MAKPIKSDPIFTPELVKIIKGFGLVSIALVLFFSFFNEKRASNTGQDQTFRMSSSARIYFSNVRGISYDREIRSDAGMQIFRNKSLISIDSASTLALMIILNPAKDEAYIYLDPIHLDWPVSLRVSKGIESEIYTFENGNKSDHLRYVEILKEVIESGEQLEIQTKAGWTAIWTSPKEIEAVKTTLEDYQKLIK